VNVNCILNNIFITIILSITPLLNTSIVHAISFKSILRRVKTEQASYPQLTLKQKKKRVISAITKSNIIDLRYQLRTNNISFAELLNMKSGHFRKENPIIRALRKKKLMVLEELINFYPALKLSEVQIKSLMRLYHKLEGSTKNLNKLRSISNILYLNIKNGGDKNITFENFSKFPTTALSIAKSQLNKTAVDYLSMSEEERDKAKLKKKLIRELYKKLHETEENFEYYMTSINLPALHEIYPTEKKRERTVQFYNGISSSINAQERLIRIMNLISTRNCFSGSESPIRQVIEFTERVAGIVSDVTPIN